uniref:Uncharacterized protein n=1 Tax=Arundo donax TaxID=35708 RepID=A0A0A8YVN9_ARUDO
MSERLYALTKREESTSKYPGLIFFYLSLFESNVCPSVPFLQNVKHTRQVTIRRLVCPPPLLQGFLLRTSCLLVSYFIFELPQNALLDERALHVPFVNDLNKHFIRN